MLDPFTLHLLRQRKDIPVEPLAAVAADLGSGLTRVTRVLFVASLLAMGPGIVALAAYVIRVFRAGGIVWPLPKWVLLANLWVIPFVLWMSAREIRSMRIHAVMLRHRRCPHCGYDLRLLPPDPVDGATVCPECGCAWALGAS
jgi:hypothetical protein